MTYQSVLISAYNTVDMSKYVLLLEKKTIGLLLQIKTKKVSARNEHFERLLEAIRGQDEALYEEMKKRYERALKEIEK